MSIWDDIKEAAIRKAQQQAKKQLNAADTSDFAGRPDFLGVQDGKGNVIDAAGSSYSAIISGSPGRIDSSIRLNSNSALVVNELLFPHNIDAIGGGFLLFRTAPPDDDPVNQDCYVRAIDGTSYFLLSIARQYSITGCPHDPAVNKIKKIGFTPNGKHIVICAVDTDNVSSATVYFGIIKNFSLAAGIVTGSTSGGSYPLSSHITLASPPSTSPPPGSVSCTTSGGGIGGCTGCSGTNTRTQTFETFSDPPVYNTAPPNSLAINGFFQISQDFNGDPYVDFVGDYSSSASKVTFFRVTGDTTTIDINCSTCFCTSGPFAGMIVSSTFSQVSDTTFSWTFLGGIHPGNWNVLKCTTNTISSSGCGGYSGSSSSGCSNFTISGTPGSPGSISALGPPSIYIAAWTDSEAVHGQFKLESLQSAPSFAQNILSTASVATTWSSSNGGCTQAPTTTTTTTGVPGDSSRIFDGIFRSKPKLTNHQGDSSDVYSEQVPIGMSFANRLYWDVPYLANPVLVSDTGITPVTPPFTFTDVIVLMDRLAEWVSMDVKAIDSLEFLTCYPQISAITIYDYAYDIAHGTVSVVAQLNGPPFDGSLYSLADWTLT